MKRFGAFFKEGVKDGYFRGDIDNQLVLTIYMHVVQGLLNPEVLSELPYSAVMVYEAMTKILFEGMLTNEGRTKYQKKTGSASRKKK